MLLSSYSGLLLEAGCDEAGRGCLAGPVFAAAVIFPPGYSDPLINDSKQLTERKRVELRKIIVANALAWAVAMVDNNKIDEVNILKASILAMHLALDKLSTRPQLILVDGKIFYPYPDIPHRCIIKGDAKYQCIAAASILAKTFRDDYMVLIHEKYPQYDWKHNKGYPTQKHRSAILSSGLSPYHRRSFKVS